MALNVGINENVILSKAEVSTENDKVCLILGFKEKGKLTSTEADEFEQMKGSGTVQTGTGSGDFSIRMWPPLPPLPTDKSNVTKTSIQLGKEGRDNLNEVKNTLHQILSCFMTSDTILFSMFKGMDDIITRDTIDSKIIEPAVIKQCFLNLAYQFTEQVVPFIDKEECALRVLLVRQSKEKHYATFRSKYVNENPIVEPAIIPLSASKLKFTAYEIKNGLNDGTPTAQAAGDAQAAEAPVEVANLFDEGK